MLGNLHEAENFLREALNLVRSITFPSLRIKVGECMTRFMMILVFHYRDSSSKMKEFFIPPDMEKYNPEPFRYLLSIYYAPNDSVSVLKGVEGWLRVRMLKIPQPMLACTIRVVVEEMLAAGLDRDAVRWTAVGLRLGRRRDWSGIAALFYCYRAVALTRLGWVKAAEVCLRRAREAADDLDRWAPAWLARAEALILRAKGDAKGARKHFAESLRLFRRIGDRYDARLVEDEMDSRQ